MKKVFLFSIILVSTLFTQLKVTSIEKLPMQTNEQWSNPVFSPNGKEIYCSNMEYNGIWQYSLQTKLLKEITRDPKSGYNFSISDDGTSIAYRRTFESDNPVERKQEAVVINVSNLSSNIIGTGNDIAVPVFVNNNPVHTNLSRFAKSTMPVYPVDLTKIFGIEATKITLLENGKKRIFDPLKNGSYIWPQLSPDRTKIVAVDMERGAFISDLTGSNIVSLGKCNAPRWSRNGKWIIGMDDKDDGHRITSSDIIATSIDGKTRIQLTNTSSTMEMFPDVSPIDNNIVVSTASGELFLLTYEEVQ